ncbi:diiron oxygenase [Embleya sp. NBC_00896]|uniref:diiron oxygenase n=1 Tax=Embleya sp. NBC_00896 TaxID=2975961 RepID=UPI00386C236E|nr:diiron oxygenase [Embleya sp. NBC_00896]
MSTAPISGTDVHGDRELRDRLGGIMALAHVNTFHPNAFVWPQAVTPENLEYLSVVAYGDPGHEREAIAYVVKELAQLAEIERHVSATMALILSEMPLHPGLGELSEGYELHHALSCFAAEELHHANTFFRYVREISGFEPRLPDSRFGERLSVFQQDDHPWVKLIALCASAYVGESVITVFERRTDRLDPDRRYFVTRLLHLHGLDEARHIKVDHIVMRELYSRLSTEQRARTRELLTAIETLNSRLADDFTTLIGKLTGVDIAEVPAYRMQMAITRSFAERLFDDDGNPRTADELLNDELRQLIHDFSGAEHVHTPRRGDLPAPRTDI